MDPETDSPRPESADPRDRTPADFLDWAASTGATLEAARRLLAGAIGSGELDPAALNRRFQVPRRLADRLGPLPLPRLRVEQVQDSPIDGFRKLLLRAPDGLPIETVVIPLKRADSASLCLSSQVGCAMGCVYCATARMPARRNLQTWEIIDQFLLGREAARELGRRVSGVVFMGMGEPFLNYDRVIAAAELLRCPFGAAVAAKAITISTVGLVREIDRYTAEGHKYRLSISLGAALDAKRAVLVPVAARTPVTEVMAAASRHAEARRSRVNLAYVCVGGFNCGEDDAEALADLVGSTPIRLDLIDVTDPSGRFQPPDPAELSKFRDALTRHLRQPVARRYSGGADIAAACGTLAGSVA